LPVHSAENTSGLPRAGDHVSHGKIGVQQLRLRHVSGALIAESSSRGNSSFPRSPEDQFLVACAHVTASSQTIQNAIAPGLDWKRVLHCAEDFGISPLLYFQLNQSAFNVPSEILRQLRLRYRQSSAQAIHQSLRLREILLALADNRISTIVMKGAALAELVYPSPGLRPMLDLDLLVRSDDLDAAAGVLTELGYSADESYQPAEWYKDHHHHLAPFIARDQSIVVELHHQVTSLRSNVSLPIGKFWQRALPAQIASAPGLVLAPEDLLLSICMHVAISQRFEKGLRDLTDISQILTTYGDEIDWEQLSRNAEEYGASNCLYYCLWATQAIAGTNLPANLLERLKSKQTLGLYQEAFLKFLVPRAIFPHSTRVRAWFANDWIGEILCPQVGVPAMIVRRLREYFHLTPNASQ
jgi:hypothetical protein